MDGARQQREEEEGEEEEAGEEGRGPFLRPQQQRTGCRGCGGGGDAGSGGEGEDYSGGPHLAGRLGVSSERTMCTQHARGSGGGGSGVGSGGCGVGNSGGGGDGRGRGDGSCVAVVVGAMVMDIQARPRRTGTGEGGGGGDGGGGQATAALARGTTAPGEVKYSHGGVGRNVAESMAALGSPPLLVSVVGDDAAGDALMRRWVSRGLRTDGIRRVHGVATPVVCAVFDEGGEMAAAVAHVDAFEAHLTWDWLERFRVDIGRAPLLLLDANLPQPALALLCDMANSTGTPVWYEPVSVSKAVRIAPFLSKVHLITPNKDELVAIASAAPPAATAAPAVANDTPSPDLRHLARHRITAKGNPDRDPAAGLPFKLLSSSANAAGAEHHHAPASAAASAPPQGRKQAACTCACACTRAGAAAAEAPPPPKEVVDELLSAWPAVVTVLRAGVRHVLLTIGAHGAALFSSSPPLSPPPCSVSDVCSCAHSDCGTCLHSPPLGPPSSGCLGDTCVASLPHECRCQSRRPGGGQLDVIDSGTRHATCRGAVHCQTHGRPSAIAPTEARARARGPYDVVSRADTDKDTGTGTVSCVHFTALSIRRSQTSGAGPVGPAAGAGRGTGTIVGTPPPGMLANFSGAGDCLVGGAAAAFAAGLPLAAAVARGMHAARVAVESCESVPYEDLAALSYLPWSSTQVQSKL